MDDCKALEEVRDLLLRQQASTNARLKHEHDKLTENERLRTRHRDLVREIELHGRAVRQSVQLQHEADAAIDRGDIEEAKRLMALAAQALPDPSKLPAAPRDVSDKSKDAPTPKSDKDEGQAPSPRPAPPAPKKAADQAAPEPKASGAHRAPASPSDLPDSDSLSGLEQRLKAHIDQGFGEIRTQVEKRSLPDGYREVLDKFSPEDLETALRLGRWANGKRWQRRNRQDDSDASHDGGWLFGRDRSRSSHDNGVAEDGDPNH